MRKIFFVVVTFLVMLITSGFVVKIVDATVQIDDDIGLLATLLAAVNRKPLCFLLKHSGTFI